MEVKGRADWVTVKVQPVKASCEVRVHSLWGIGWTGSRL